VVPNSFEEYVEQRGGWTPEGETCEFCGSTEGPFTVGDSDDPIPLEAGSCTATSPQGGRRMELHATGMKLRLGLVRAQP
jgi:hypothetical protein